MELYSSKPCWNSLSPASRSVLLRESRGRRIAGQRQDKRAAFGDHRAEESQRADAQALGGRQEMFAQEVCGALCLAAIAHVVIAQLEDGVLLCGGGGRRGQTGGSRGSHELSALHYELLIADCAAA